MKKQQARNLYFQTELTQTHIAELLDVDRKTIYLWIKEGRWAEIKRSAQQTPSILAEQYYTQLLAINEMIAGREEQPYPTPQEAETIRKLTLTIKHIKDGQTRGETIEVLMNFIHQLTKTDLALAKQILPYADEYIKDYNNDPIIKPKEKMEIKEQEVGIEEIEVTEKKSSEESPQPDPSQQQTSDSQNIEPPTITELSNCRIAELPKTGYIWAMHEQPVFTMLEALTRYKSGDWSDNTWQQFLKWHSQQNGEAPNTISRNDP
ncbi:MAG TPA: hypothetical protein VN721_08595 [Flavipsychrobacter sp.]|nr:hypothetical protein [Flavipsychrobacter sp.]